MSSANSSGTLKRKASSSDASSPPEVEEAKEKEEVRVYCDMVADLFHMGHVNFLRRAKAKGTYLIVGLHSDEAVQSYKRTPILTLEERCEVVGACKYVDEVVPGAPLSITKAFIDKHRIHKHLHAHSPQEDADYRAINGVSYDLGIFERLDYTQGVSTSDILKRILAREGLSPSKLKKKDER